jgi:hypothetical protein
MTLRFALPMTTIRTGAGLALLGVLGVGIATTNTDAVVAGHFAAALEAAPGQVAVDVAAGADKVLVSGSEAYWLERRRHEGAGAAIEPAAWSAPPVMGGVAVGSRITVATGKEARVFEVVAITETAAEGSGKRSERRMVITCRDLSTEDGRLQTFATTVGGPEAPRSARAL